MGETSQRKHLTRDIADALSAGNLEEAASVWLHSGARAEDPQTAGNHALTSWAGLLLIPMLGLVALTGLVFGELWRAHLIIGLALVPLLGVKLITTTYRALRYYTGSGRYRQAGPPEWPARILAPFLIAATAVAMVSGIIMWRLNNQDRPWSTIHTDSVAVMGVLVGLHVLFYLPRAAYVVWRDLRESLRSGRVQFRIGVVSVVLVAGIALGFALQSNVPFPVHIHHFQDG